MCMFNPNHPSVSAHSVALNVSFIHLSFIALLKSASDSEVLTADMEKLPLKVSLIDIRYPGKALSHPALSYQRNTVIQSVSSNTLT